MCALLFMIFAFYIAAFGSWKTIRKAAHSLEGILLTNQITKNKTKIASCLWTMKYQDDKMQSKNKPHIVNHESRIKHKIFCKMLAPWLRHVFSMRTSDKEKAMRHGRVFQVTNALHCMFCCHLDVYGNMPTSLINWWETGNWSHFN